MRALRTLLIPFLAGVAVFCVFKYAGVRIELKNTLEEKQKLLQTLKKEEESRELLSRRNRYLTGNLRAQKEKITQLFSRIKEHGQAYSNLNSRLSVLKIENARLADDKQSLSSQLNIAIKENKDIKAQLASALKFKGLYAQLQSEQKKVSKNIVKGNRGYLTEKGSAAAGTKVRIEVTPVTAE